MTDENHGGPETTAAAPAPTPAPGETPRGSLAAIRRYARFDLPAGFLVFLIALPLCLGISMASGYPPIAGIFTAIIGGVVGSLLSDSELTIKGPAAGLIVIAIGAVTELGHGDPILGYKLALGVGVVAGVVQILFGLLRAGSLGEFFPSAAVHGMLASIGIIIASKQIHTILGVVPTAKTPLALLAEVPRSIAGFNPEVAIIGVLSLTVLFGLPLVKSRIVKMVPAPMVVLLLAIPLGRYFDLSHAHIYSWHHHVYSVGMQYLVRVPDHLFQAVTLPVFAGVLTGPGLKYVVMFALVGTLESLLSAKAIDLLDPWKRRTSLDRDIVAIGVGNTLSSLVGGLPMISEIVRSSANINNGARTRLSNLFHGLFLLGFVALVPGLIRQIPLSALAAMLVYTGTRLASPKVFVHAYKVGPEQLFIFTATVLATLLTDLLIGIGVGVLAELLCLRLQGAPLVSLLRARVTLGEDAEATPPAPAPAARVLHVHGAAVFCNWLGLRRQIAAASAGGPAHQPLVIDLSDTALVDHTVMTKLSELTRGSGAAVRIVGLDAHRGITGHPLASRRRRTGSSTSTTSSTSDGSGSARARAA